MQIEILTEEDEERHGNGETHFGGAETKHELPLQVSVNQRLVW